MIPKDCKRLAEVDFPIAVVSKHSVREKSIRHGHPSTLHLWWARRPLGACRSMLLALLLPDPCDPSCPENFKVNARKALTGLIGVCEGDEGLRKTLLTFIGEVANWDVANNSVWIDVARQLVKAAHPEETPLVVDPFAGGGSIPIEALRLGCDAFASDLNPVACLILKVMLEDIPRHGPELADELRRVGTKIKQQAEEELAEFYPKDPDGAIPIAYLWARTVRCETPNCGAEIPLTRSFWLCKKANRKRALKPGVIRRQGEQPSIEFEIFEPVNEREVASGTVTRARATCLCCNTVLPPERVRAQLAEQHGGADVIFDAHGNRIGGARLLAVVTLQPGQQGRHYRLPTDQDYRAVLAAQEKLRTLLDEWERGGRKGLCPVPDEPLPPVGTLGFRVQRYGMLQWGDLFTARQKVALVSFASHVHQQNNVSKECKGLLAIVIGRMADATSSLTRWLSSGEEVKNVFSRQALPIVWDYGETNPISEASRSWFSAIEAVYNVVSTAASARTAIGQIQQADACQSPLPRESVEVYFTDPPYYDAIPYSDLSDFFLVWLKRSLPALPWLRDPFDQSNPLSPKTYEAVQDKTKIVNGCPKDRAFFEETMARSFADGRRLLREDGIGSIMFAHKTTEGWEALLSGVIRGRWVITGSWPIPTEAGNRLRARDSAALATSVHLVCRPRPEDAPVGDWGVVLRELPPRVGDWIERLQDEGIRGADLVFACIGPALEIFSRYSKVETADGSEVNLDQYLEKVWEVVGRTALEQVLGTAEAQARNGLAGALEEDARLTALFLWTLQSTNGQNGHTDPSEEGDEETDADDEEPSGRGMVRGYSLAFDVVRRFAQPLGIELTKWEGRIIETTKGVVRLMPVSERTKQLFGEDSEEAVADWIRRDSRKDPQLDLFSDIEQPPTLQLRGRSRRIDIDPRNIDAHKRHQVTTLDRVHAGMLLQSSGRSNALRTLIKTEQERGLDFLRLANALSALYPASSEEKRILDAMILAVPR
ncbi:MAG: DUF1156 domain-containing protein [Armatimonadetes bacterium]|nr:DUF1156 domain-containing protein [Armatimonadota bacterium]